VGKDRWQQEVFYWFFAWLVAGLLPLSPHILDPSVSSTLRGQPVGIDPIKLLAHGELFWSAIAIFITMAAQLVVDKCEPTLAKGLLFAAGALGVFAGGSFAYGIGQLIALNWLIPASVGLYGFAVLCSGVRVGLFLRSTWNDVSPRS
jgi:hypothetical protein